jgi:hypothetical protein
MKRGLVFAFLLALASPLAWAAQPPAAAGTSAAARVSPIGKCMDPMRITEWHVLDARTLLVRNGPHRFLIHTRHACPRLGRYGGGLNFHPSPDKQVTLMRICGDAGETVSSRDQPPCGIASVQRIDKARFERLKKHSERSGSAAEQNLPDRSGQR